MVRPVDPYLDALVRALRVYVRWLNERLEAKAMARSAEAMVRVCEEAFFEGGVDCSPDGYCTSSDDVLNAMCEDIWQELADELGWFDDEEDYEDW